MADYIDRQAAIVRAVKPIKDDNIAYDVKEALKSMPSADVIDVARCKDCKWSKQYMLFGREVLMCKQRKFAECLLSKTMIIAVTERENDDLRGNTGKGEPYRRQS